jgi:hypothetical protein
MNENEVDSILRENNFRFEISVNSQYEIQYYYKISKLIKFIDEQRKKWEDDSTVKWSQVLENYNKFAIKLLSYVEYEGKGEDEKRSFLQNLINQLFDYSSSHPLLIYNKKLIQFLCAIDDQHPGWSNEIISQLVNPENSNIFYRGDTKLTIAFYTVLSLINHTENSSNEFRQLDEQIYQSLSELRKTFSSWKEEHITEKKAYEEKFSDFIKDSTRTLEEFTHQNENTFNQVRKTYAEQVRIEEPSKLWTSKMEEYRKNGWKWVYFSIGDSLIISLICVGFFIFIPLTFTTSEIGLVNLTSTIKWMILTGIGLGTFIYLLRLFVKLALSSFHMSRDAEEKSALTSFYLSLIHDGGIDPEKEKELKNIVMNALFARVDTGLLKGDTSPTIPTAGLSEVVRLVSGQKP